MRYGIIRGCVAACLFVMVARDGVAATITNADASISAGLFLDETGGTGDGLIYYTNTDGRDLAISGGTFRGGSLPHTAGGSALNVCLFGTNSTATVSGGVFLPGALAFAALDVFASGSTNRAIISGGTFSPSTGPHDLYLSLQNLATVTFMGSGWHYQVTDTFPGVQFGLLTDGNPLNARVMAALGTHVIQASTTQITFSGTADLPITPEPSSWMLFGIGITMVIVRRNTCTK